MDIIQANNLIKYYGKARGVDGVNFTVKEGEIFGFIGPNGAGKSTTIRLLLNLLFPTSGSASIFGLDCVKESTKIRSRTGYIPSDAMPYDNMSVMEFLSYSGRFYGTAGLETKIKELAEIFDLDLERDISELSTGNRKKAAIIQGLAHSPALLILDEPTAGLDPLVQADFFSLLRRENARGTTIFFSSHVLSEVQELCKRVAIIRAGRIIAVEEIDALREKQLKKVSIRFPGAPPASGLGISGCENVQISGPLLTFLYSGEINALTAAMAMHKLDRLIIEEPSLEEVFIHYYEHGGNNDE